MEHKAFESYLLQFPNTWLDYPFGENISVYKVGDPETKEGKMFALIHDGTNPLRVSLKCAPELAEALRETRAQYHELRGEGELPERGEFARKLKSVGAPISLMMGCYQEEIGEKKIIASTLLKQILKEAKHNSTK